jgi:Holliday junction resolvase RusA-like endonuclease
MPIKHIYDILEVKPLSLHQFYSIYRNRQYITSLGRSYKKIFSDYFHTQSNKICHNKPVKLYIEFHFADKRKHDLDNVCKPLLDALTNILYVDDSLIYDLCVKKLIGQPNNYIHIEINEI